jgi:hypothetical protein
MTNTRWTLVLAVFLIVTYASNADEAIGDTALGKYVAKTIRMLSLGPLSVPQFGGAILDKVENVKLRGGTECQMCWLTKNGDPCGYLLIALLEGDEFQCLAFSATSVSSRLSTAVAVDRIGQERDCFQWRLLYPLWHRGASNSDSSK